MVKDDDFRLKVVQQILDERDELLVERLRVRKEVNKWLAKDRELERQLFDHVAAGRVFGQPIALARDPKDFESMATLQKAMTEQKSGRPWIPGESKAMTLAEIEEYTTKAKEKAEAKKAAEKAIAGGPDLFVEPAKIVPEGESEGGQRIRDRILAHLRKIHPAGAKAADIRKFLTDTHGLRTHEKTTGMTLFRLSREGLVRREKRTWFSVQTENPGESPPGSEADAK